MKEKKIFSLKLFLEGLRQLRLICGVVLGLYMVEIMLEYIAYDGYFEQLGLNDYNRFIVCTPLFGGIILTMKLFKFMNSRKESDFYHSLPYKRSCMFISFYAAIVTWITAVMALPTVFIVILYKLTTDVTIDIKGDMITFISYYIMGLILITGVLLAKTLTGNIVSNLVVSGIIIAGPRIFLTFIILAFEECSGGIYPTENLPGLITGKYNIVIRLLSYYNYVDLKTCLYSLGIIVIYFALALFLYIRRNSELAENVAKNKYINAIFRICLTVIVCMPTIISIAEVIVSGDKPYEFIESIIIGYVIALVVYFVYEIITKKTVVGILKTIKGLVIVVALNVILIFGISGISKSVLGYVPECEDIDSIYMIDEDYNYAVRSKRVYYYMDMLESKTPIRYKNGSDEERYAVKNVVSDWEDTINEIKNDTYSMNGCEYKFMIKLKNGKTIYRNIYVDEYTERVINEVYRQNEDLQNKKLSFTVYKFVELDSPYTYRSEFSKSTQQEMYKAFLEDYNKLSLKEKEAVISDGRNTGDEIIVLVFKKGKKYYQVRICVNDKLPSLQKYLYNEIINSNILENDYNEEALSPNYYKNLYLNDGDDMEFLYEYSVLVKIDGETTKDYVANYTEDELQTIFDNALVKKDEMLNVEEELIKVIIIDSYDCEYSPDFYVKYTDEVREIVEKHSLN